MRRFLFAAVLMMLATSYTAAQGETPKAELFGGYSYAGDNSHGWHASVAGNVNRWLGVVADFNGQYTGFDGPDESERIRTHTYLFGPRVSARNKSRVTPFAHALFGASHVSSEVTIPGQTFRFTDTSFAAALGGGLDVRVSRRVAIRAFQADYLRTNLFGETQNKGRLSAGIVIRLGSK